MGKARCRKWCVIEFHFLKMNNRKCLYICIYIVFIVKQYITVNGCPEYVEKYKRIRVCRKIEEDKCSGWNKGDE